MLVLYYAPNTCALASHIALEDAGAEYRLRRIDFDKEEQGDVPISVEIRGAGVAG